MARIRTIKPEFWTDEDLSSISAEAALLAIALLNYADDEGYFKAHPGLVRAACMPLRDTSVKVSDMLGELTEISYIRVGTGSDGKRYGQIVNFAKHQVINRAAQSQIRKISITWDSFTEDSLKTHGALTDVSLLEKEMEKEMEQGKEREVEVEVEGGCKGETMAECSVSEKPAAPASGACVTDANFEIFWAQYPQRHGANPKPRAFRGWAARIRQGAMPDEMIAGAMAYAQYCDRLRITGTEYVMQAATFLGPDLHFRNDWRKPNVRQFHFDINDQPF